MNILFGDREREREREKERDGGRERSPVYLSGGCLQFS